MDTDQLIRRVMAVIRREISKEYYLFPDYLIQNLAGAIVCEIEQQKEVKQ